MRGSRGLMRGRGGKRGVEDEQDGSWFAGIMSNDLYCWRSSKGYERTSM